MRRLLARDVLPTAAERAEPLPGDELAPGAQVVATHAVTVPAPPGAVWPWLVQMGCDRGGWYAYDRLDNGGRPSATRIIPALQALAEGDVVPGWPGRAGGMTVVRLVPRELLLLDWSGAGLRFTWAFVLRPAGPGATRLLVRARVALPARLGPAALVGRAILPGHDVMQRRQLLAIRHRSTAESAHADI